MFVLGQAVVCILGGLTAYINLLGKIGNVSERLTAIEVRNEGTDRRVSRVAHSPHDPYGWDKSIDKYLDRHYEMTNQEWMDWYNRCESVIKDETKPKEDRIIAVQLAAVCTHKLMIPPPLRKQIETATNEAEDKIVETESKKTTTIDDPFKAGN